MALAKNRGPLLTETKVAGVDTIPQRWVTYLGKTITSQKCPADKVPDSITTALIESKLEQKETDERNLINTTIGDIAGKTMVFWDYDKESGVHLARTESIIVTGSEGSLTGLDGDGKAITIEPFGNGLSLKTTRLPTGITDYSYVTREYVGNLPRVLTQFNTYAFTARSKRAPYGNSTTSHGLGANLDPDYIHPAGDILSAGFQTELKNFNGEYAVTVRERWQASAWTGLSSNNLQKAATSFSWATPFGSGSVPDCLHAAITIDYSTGTTHLIYQFISGEYSFAATSPTTISGSIVIQDSQRPYEGGYLRTTKTITV